MPDTPQQNGVSKRHNRTSIDMVRSMLSNSTLPVWGFYKDWSRNSSELSPLFIL